MPISGVRAGPVEKTDADRQRVVEGMASSLNGGRHAAHNLTALISRLTARWFVVRDAQEEGGPCLLQPRWALSFLRGPMTRAELTLARSLRTKGEPRVDPGPAQPLVLH